MYLSILALSISLIALSNAAVETLTPQFFPSHNSQRVRISYGPYTVPAMDAETNGMKNFRSRSVELPCTDCLLTFIQAGLEYPDGTEATAENGMWLHHTVFSNTMRKSLTCPESRGGDRFFASGNEKTAMDICNSGTDKAGYYIAPGDNFAMVAELMNMHHHPRDAILTMTYEFIPDGIPPGFAKARSMWLDIGGCKSSEFPAKLDAEFQYESPGFTVNENSTGRVLSVGSHLHDGGTHLAVRKNGKVVCDAKADYGEHIESITRCSDLGATVPGDEWSLVAYYDTSLHEPMTNMDGSLEPVMGISLVFIAEESEVDAPAHRRVGVVVGIVVSVVAIVVGVSCWSWRQGGCVKRGWVGVREKLAGWNWGRGGYISLRNAEPDV